jgi:TolB-like protein
MDSFWGELKRRKVVQVAAVYGLVAWLLIQIASTVEEPLGLPGWFDTIVIVLLAIGFPIAVILSWAFDLTPDGIVRDEGRDGTAEPRSRRIGYALIALLVVAVGYFLADDFLLDDEPDRLPNSVAVLPFENLSLDPEDAFFSAGIHDELLNQLARIRDLTVIARTSVLQYEGATTPIAQIADELNVETVMEGTVRFGGDLVRITAQLIDPSTGGHLWSETYEREFDAAKIFAIETDIATSIAAALEAEITDTERANIDRPLTISTDAWLRYIEAMELQHWNMNPDEKDETYIRFHALLDEAIALDPDFATGYALKAIDYSFGLLRALPRDEQRTRRQWRDLALEFADRALRIDPANGLAYMARAMTHHMSRDVSSARRDFEHALELDPNNVDILDDFARFNRDMGRHDEAVAQGRRIMSLDPRQLWTGAWILALSGEPEEAVEILETSVSSDQPFWRLHSLAVAEGILGNREAVYEYLRQMDDLGYEDMAVSARAVTTAMAGWMYGLLDRTEEAARAFAVLEELSATHEIPAYFWALGYLGMKDYGRALQELRAAAAPDQAAPAYSVGFMLGANVLNDPVLERPEFVAARKAFWFDE